MNYNPSISRNKAARVALPAIPAAVVVWAARQFLGLEIPGEVAIFFAACIGSALEWARNVRKHGWKRARA